MNWNLIVGILISDSGVGLSIHPAAFLRSCESHSSSASGIRRRKAESSPSGRHRRRLETDLRRGILKFTLVRVADDPPGSAIWRCPKRRVLGVERRPRGTLNVES